MQSSSMSVLVERGFCVVGFDVVVVYLDR